MAEGAGDGGEVRSGGLANEAAGTTAEPDDRQRYRELLEELRTILPGVQVLFAFLLIAPFSQRFSELDEFGLDLYGAALVGTALAMVLFLAPASYHRIAPRRPREARIRTAVRLMKVGMMLLATSVALAVFTVMRFIFGAGVGALAAASIAGTVLLVWYVVPLLRGSGVAR